MKRHVIYSDDAGFFLGDFLGMGFWSKWDTAGQSEAPAWDKKEEVEKFIIENMSGGPNGIQVVELDCNGPHGGATIQDVISAGYEGWEPDKEVWPADVVLTHHDLVGFKKE